MTGITTAVAQPPGVREWGLMVLKVDGHGLAEEIQEEIDTLDASGTTPQAYITVRAEQAGKITDYSVADRNPNGPPAAHYLTPAAGGVSGQDAEVMPMLSAGALRDFVCNTMDKYPARHYMIAVDGHSEQLRKALGPLHQALEAGATQCGHKIDVLAFDSCFMAQAETATAFQDVASVMVASEEAVGGARPVEKLAQELVQQPMTAAQVGTYFVGNSEESTLSAMDLQHTAAFNQKMKALGDEIRNVDDSSSLRRIRYAIRGAQHFYTEGIVRPLPFHNTVDIAHATERMLADQRLCNKHPQLAVRAQEVVDSLRCGNGLMLAEKHADKVERTLQLDIFDVRSAHGLSVYMPTTPRGMRDEYTWFGDSQFSRDTGWNQVIDHVTGSKSPAYIARASAEYAHGVTISRLGKWLEKMSDRLQNADKPLRHTKSANLR